MTPEERRRKLEEIAQRVVDRLEREWPAPDAHINELEDLTERVGREMMRELTQELLRERAPRREGNQSACPCGNPAAYKGDQALTLVTAHGRLPIQRAYYYCERCRQGHCPLDREWGLGPAQTTPTVQSLVGALDAEVPYHRVPRLLRRLGLPIHLGVKSVELIAQRLGNAVAQAPPQVEGAAQGPLAAALDGVMVPTWEGYQEARCGVLYEPDPTAPRTPTGEAALRKEFVGSLTAREQVIAQLCRRVEQRRPSPETKVAALGDGAGWIWSGYAAHLPHRVEILDFYHVVQPLAAVSAAWHGEGTARGKAWLRRMKELLVSRGPGPLLRSLRAWQPETAAAAAVKRRELGYFANNRERMHYPDYLQQQLPIGSGAVEGACKHLISDRFKGTGMRWQPETAEPLIHLRAALLTQPDLDLRAYVS
jgi:hypothetical protein